MLSALPWLQPLWWPSRRYVYSCWLLLGLFLSSRTFMQWGWLSLAQHEHWHTCLLLVWFSEQQRLSQKSLDVLEQCFLDGELPLQASHLRCFRDLLALHHEGRYEVVLNQLYGDFAASTDPTP